MKTTYNKLIMPVAKWVKGVWFAILGKQTSTKKMPKFGVRPGGVVCESLDE